MRSKTFFVANVLATLYAGGFSWFIGNAVSRTDGGDVLEAIAAYFDVWAILADLGVTDVSFLYVIALLFIAHMALFCLGCLIGWIAFAFGSSGGGKFAAVLYMLGTICFPVEFFFNLPIVIIAFVGAGRQKKKNQMAAA